MLTKPARWAVAALLAAACVAGPQLVGRAERPKGVRRDIEMTARQFAYNPPVFTVNVGDEVHLSMKSLDVVHGFYLEGHGIDALIRPGKKLLLRESPSHDEPIEVDEVVFVARSGGKYRYRCSQTCGVLHPFMLGEMIVEPNRLYPSAIGLVAAILLGSLVLAWPAGVRRAGAGSYDDRAASGSPEPTEEATNE